MSAGRAFLLRVDNRNFEFCHGLPDDMSSPSPFLRLSSFSY